MKKIILTGGGTAGHVTPNLALVPRLKDFGYTIIYIGSYEGIEKRLAEEAGIPYYGISSGKLRRYFDWKNFSDPLRVLKGYQEAKKLLKDLKPDIVFSKGGFVSVPVVTAAGRKGIPVIIHESDMTPGLANKLSFPSASKICCTFKETLKCIPTEKGVFTGSPIRRDLLSGNKLAACSFTGFTVNKPTILIIGGSLGAAAINEYIRKILPSLLKDFQVVHICGKNKVDPTLTHLHGYVQYEYVSEELRDIFARTDIIVSRAGSNAICEFLALKKPALLIPLPANASRGDQILNAASFEKQGFSKVLQENDITEDILLQNIRELYEHRSNYIHAMEHAEQSNAIVTIVDLIEKISQHGKQV